MPTVLTDQEVLDLVRQRFPGDEARILAAIGSQAAILRAQLADNGGNLIGVDPPAGYTSDTLNALLAEIVASIGVGDGDKGDITVSGSGSAWTINLGVVGSTKLGGDITAAGKALITGADAAAQRSSLGLGTAATQNVGAFEAAGAIAAHEASADPHPQYLTAAEGNAAYQPLDAELTALAGQTSAADRLFYFTGVGAGALATFTSFARTLVDDADAATARTTLGLGTAATQPSTAFAPSSHVGSGGSQHTDATTSVSGFMSGTDKTKLDGIATGATANATDAALRDRATHTGTQAASTISDFNATARAQIEAMLAAGTNVTFAFAGSGATRTLTINAAGGGGGSTDWIIATTGQTLADGAPVLAVITTTQNFPLPTSPTAGDRFVVGNARGSTAGALVRVQTDAGQQIIGAAVGDDVTVAPGETIYLVARSASLLEIV